MKSKKISRSQSETKCNNKLLVIRISLSRKIIKRNSEIGVSNDKQSPQDVEVFFCCCKREKKNRANKLFSPCSAVDTIFEIN